MTKFVAVLEQNVNSPIAYGLGESREAAMADAAEWADDATVLTTYPCSDYLASRVELGTPSCHIVDGIARAFGEDV